MNAETKRALELCAKAIEREIGGDSAYDEMVDALEAVERVLAADEPCSRCKGHGRLATTTMTPTSTTSGQMDCPVCEGSGRAVDEVPMCAVCEHGPKYHGAGSCHQCACEGKFMEKASACGCACWTCWPEGPHCGNRKCQGAPTRAATGDQPMEPNQSQENA